MKTAALMAAGLWTLLGAAGLAQTNAQTNPRDQLIAETAPSITVALSEPMQSLQDKAASDRSEDAFNLGLAMFGGRFQTVGLEPEDIAMLKAMELRVIPLAQAYLNSHPNPKLTRDKWRTILKGTNAEMELVDRFQKRLMADYWLSKARLSYTVNSIQGLGTPASRGAPGAVGQQANPTSVTGAYSRRELDMDTLILASHCVSAVRKEVGLRLYRSSEVPVSIRLLWDFAPYDAEGYVETQLKAGEVKNRKMIPVGAAACGTDDQFKAYVAMLTEVTKP